MLVCAGYLFDELLKFPILCKPQKHQTGNTADKRGRQTPSRTRYKQLENYFLLFTLHACSKHNCCGKGNLAEFRGNNWLIECQRKQTGKHFEICTQQEMRNDWKLRGKRKKHSVFLKNFWGCRPTLFRIPCASKLSRPPLSTCVVTLVSAINCGWSLRTPYIHWPSSSNTIS